MHGSQTCVRPKGRKYGRKGEGYQMCHHGKMAKRIKRRHKESEWSLLPAFDFVCVTLFADMSYWWEVSWRKCYRQHGGFTECIKRQPPHTNEFMVMIWFRVAMLILIVEKCKYHAEKNVTWHDNVPTRTNFQQFCFRRTDWRPYSTHWMGQLFLVAF